MARLRPRPTSAKSHGRAPHESGKAFQGRVRRLEPVRGPFEVELLFRRPDKNRMGDLDNPIKPLMDWLQRVELIENDRSCDRIQAQ